MVLQRLLLVQTTRRPAPRLVVGTRLDYDVWPLDAILVPGNVWGGLRLVVSTYTEWVAQRAWIGQG